MKRLPQRIALSLVTLVALIGSAACARPGPRSAPTAAAAPATEVATATPAPTLAPTPADPFALISEERLFAALGELTSIRANQGWRSSATRGEAEALDTVAARLATMPGLARLGLEVERQSFRIPLSLQLWQAQLELMVGGRAVEVPANGLRGSRDDLSAALTFDTDGALNDSDPNPLVGEGPALAVRSLAELRRLAPAGAQGKVLLVDYAGVDRVVASADQAGSFARALLEAQPAAIVLVTHFSNRPGESHGTFVAEGSIFSNLKSRPAPPLVYARLEDLAPAGIARWDDLARVQRARVTLDADLFSPANSGNLVARIPGANPSQAVILGAHIDSPNVAGAMDDGGGAAVLLEVARVLGQAQVRPPVDLYLAWFGSEEAGLYGSAHFAATHQELLDRTLAMLEVDCLTRPLDGISARLSLDTWSYGWLGDGRLAWPDYLSQAAARQGAPAQPDNLYGIDSDNSSFAGFGVPNADLSYMDPRMEELGLHYAGHLHDPYDTVELARDVAEPLVQMVRVALTAALQAGRDQPDLRVAPAPRRRAVFVGSHTEAVHMSPAALLQFGMLLTWEGYDVDLVPYGRAVTAEDLEGAALVVALPVVDYPYEAGGPAAYDEAWQPEEVAALEAYVAGGGLLVLTDSAHRLKYMNTPLDANEDWSDANALAGRFGITYQSGVLPGASARAEGASPLLDGVAELKLIEGNGVPLGLQQGQVLARAGGQPAAALVPHGRGQVLALADLGILGASSEKPPNLRFWQNLARYAR